MSQPGWTVAMIAEQVGGRVQGEGAAPIDGLDELAAAGPDRVLQLIAGLRLVGEGPPISMAARGQL